MKRIFLLVLTMIYLLAHVSCNCNTYGREKYIHNLYGRTDYFRILYISCHDRNGNKMPTEISVDRPEIYNLLIFFDTNLVNIPALAFHEFNNVYRLNLNDSGIETLEMGSFLGLKNLKELYLENNTITNIELGTFNHINSLILLDLSRNRLRTINNETFKGMVNLKTLLLKENNIETIADYSFSTQRNINNIDLSSNKITTLHESIFYELFTLKSLNISGNQFSSLPLSTFKDLKNLTMLDISNNFLSDIPFGLLAGLVQLQSLNVSQNKLTVLDSKSIASLTKLEILDIAKNNIYYLNADELTALIPLGSIHLDENQWTCDVLFEIIKEFTSSKVTVESGSVYNSENIKGISCKNDKIQSNESVVVVGKPSTLQSIPSKSEVRENQFYQHISNILLEIVGKLSNNNEFVKNMTNIYLQSTQILHDLAKNVSQRQFTLPTLKNSIQHQNTSEETKYSVEILSELLNEVKAMNVQTIDNNMHKDFMETKDLLHEMRENSKIIVKILQERNQKLEVTEESSIPAVDNANLSLSTDLSKFLNKIRVQSENSKIGLDNFMKNISESVRLLQTKIDAIVHQSNDNRLSPERLQGISTNSNGGYGETSVIIFLSVTVVLLLAVLALIMFRKTDILKRFNRKTQPRSRSDVDLMANSDAILNSSI